MKKLKIFIIIILFILFILIYILFLFLIKNFDLITFIIFNSIILLLLYNFGFKFYNFVLDFILQKFYKGGFNKNINNFIEYISFSFSINDLIENIKKYLELKSGFNILILDNGSVIYKTPGRLLESNDVIDKLLKIDSSENIFGFDRNFILKDNDNSLFGYMLKIENFIFIIFSYYLSLIKKELIYEMYDKLLDFTNRKRIIDKMYEISSKAQEWKLLSEIQNSFLSVHKPSFNDIDVVIEFKPLVNVSGDFYDIIKINDEKSLFLIGDVSGKGLSASLLTVIVLNTIRVFKDKPLEFIIKEVDRSIKDMEFEDKFITLIMCLYNHKNGYMEIVNAAMPKVIHINKNNIIEYDTNLPVIGMLDLPPIETKRIKFDNGDILFLGSDGIFEAKGENKEYQELDNLKNFLFSNDDIKTIGDNIMNDLQNFMIKKTDDITFMIIKRR